MAAAIQQRKWRRVITCFTAVIIQARSGYQDSLLVKRRNDNHSPGQAIKNLYDKAQSAVLFYGSTGDWFRTTVGVRQGCLLSPTLFNIFIERIMSDALDDHEGSVSIGGRFITNFRFADDIVVNAEEEEEAGVLIDRLDTITTRYKMEIGPDKAKLMTNNPNGFQREIKRKGQRLEEVENFKYIGANHLLRRIKTRDSFQDSPETAALSRLKIIWRDKNISLASKVKLMRTLNLSTLLYFMPVRAGPWQQNSRKGSKL